MAQIITYKEGCYSQIKLNSGERILLSIAQTGTAIFKLRFWGLFPGEKIAEWSPKDLARFMLFFGGAPESQTPFNYTVEKLALFDDIESLRQYLNQAPSALDLARQEYIIEQMRNIVERK